jgi:hypothetical protein
MISLGISIFFFKPSKSNLPNSKEFTSTLVHLQYMALLNHDAFEYQGLIQTDYPIRYNADGNINMGQSIQFNLREITLLIGTGKIHEKRIYDD